MKRVLAVIAAVALSSLGVVIAGASAQASVISPGRAVVRIDAPTAIVQSTGANTYRIVLAKGASGQWMGERTVKSGKKKSLVRDLTAAKFAKSWKNLKYSKSGVGATLSWQKNAQLKTAVIKLAPPKVTSKGVVFDFTSTFAIPAQLADVSIHVQQAPKSKRSTLTSYTISGGLMFSINVLSTYEVKARIYNVGNNNTCWGTKDIKGSEANEADWQYISVGSNNCSDVHYENGFQYNQPGGNDLNYGVNVEWPYCNNQSTLGQAVMTLTVKPDDATSSFWYQQSTSWTCTQT